MGTFGAGITQDDTVADIIGFVTDRLKASASLNTATAEARAKFHDLESDEDEGPLLWLALAAVQWKYGTLDTEILHRVRADIEAERGLERWREDAKSLKKRKETLAKFLAQIEVQNPKPSPQPRLIVRKAQFQTGDCLAVHLQDGRYTAALVLKEDNSRPEYGMNLIGGLDYLDANLPAIKVFESRHWLKKENGTHYEQNAGIAWYQNSGFRKVKGRINLVGNISIIPSDPKDSQWHSGWQHIEAHILFIRENVPKVEV